MSNSSENKIQETAQAYHAKEPELELPIEPEFVSLPPRLTPTAMHQWCEEMISLGAKRKKEKYLESRVEFVLRK